MSIVVVAIAHGRRACWFAPKSAAKIFRESVALNRPR
jgi:hypothetical protein